jgi:predicted aspartyl protease
LKIILWCALGIALLGDAAPTPLPRTLPLFSTIATAPVVLPAVFDDRVLVKTDIDGHSLWMHLDTGSSSLFLGAQDAKAIGATVDPSNGYTQSLPVSIGSVTAEARFRVLPHYGFESNGRHVSGLIGGAFFHANIVTIDFPRKLVTFYPPGTFVPPAGVSPLPIDLSANVPLVTASIGGQRGVFLLDTGSNVTELNSVFARKIRLGLYRGTVTIAGNGQQTLEPVYESPPILLAGTTVLNTQVEISKWWLDQDDGLIGRNVLSNFSLTLDYAHFQAYIVPKA